MIGFQDMLSKYNFYAHFKQAHEMLRELERN